MSDISEFRQLTVDELDDVSGGNPIAVYIAVAVGAAIMQKAIDDSGLLDSVVEYGDDGIKVGGKNITKGSGGPPRRPV